jgi:hypothetical protein
MLSGRVPWWIYLIAIIYILTFGFNARQEVWGPAITGWVPSWPAARVADVLPGRPMERAGLRAGNPRSRKSPASHWDTGLVRRTRTL